jgi:hypothetical protein
VCGSVKEVAEPGLPAVALRPLLVSILYAVGVLSTVFHFSNGLWTLGITWGLWTSPAAMRRANWISIAIGVLLGGAGLGALGGLRNVDVEQARTIENRMDEVKRMLEGGQPSQSAPAVRAAEPHGALILPASGSAAGQTPPGT